MVVATAKQIVAAQNAVGDEKMANRSTKRGSEGSNEEEEVPSSRSPILPSFVIQFGRPSADEIIASYLDADPDSADPDTDVENPNDLCPPEFEIIEFA
ncbi:hypothetical protein ACTXT7_002246 [Hymenolepis weldensis]